MPVGLAKSVTVVFDGCAEESVTVSVLLAPTTTWLVAGCKATTVGKAGVTVM